MISEVRKCDKRSNEFYGWLCVLPGFLLFVCRKRFGAVSIITPMLWHNESKESVVNKRCFVLRVVTVYAMRSFAKTVASR